MTNQAWRIYYSDALAKTELTQSPARVKWAREEGHKVRALFELGDFVKKLAEIGVVTTMNEDGSLNFSRYVEMMGS